MILTQCAACAKPLAHDAPLRPGADRVVGAALRVKDQDLLVDRPQQIELEEEPSEVTPDGNTVQQEVLVRRADDETWTIVNWQLSRHSGRWLTDSLDITE